MHPCQARVSGFGVRLDVSGLMFRLDVPAWAVPEASGMAQVFIPQDAGGQGRQGTRGLGMGGAAASRRRCSVFRLWRAPCPFPHPPAVPEASGLADAIVAAELYDCDHTAESEIIILSNNRATKSSKNTFLMSAAIQ
jgi:hypothetical protein